MYVCHARTARTTCPFLHFAYYNHQWYDNKQYLTFYMVIWHTHIVTWIIITHICTDRHDISVLIRSHGLGHTCWYTSNLQLPTHAWFHMHMRSLSFVAQYHSYSARAYRARIYYGKKWWRLVSHLIAHIIWPWLKVIDSHSCIYTDEHEHIHDRTNVQHMDRYMMANVLICVGMYVRNKQAQTHMIWYVIYAICAWVNGRMNEWCMIYPYAWWHTIYGSSNG